MKNIFLGVLACFLACMVGVILCGCETESADQAEVIVTPGSSTVSEGGSVILTASGWETYRWTLSDDSLGVLNRRTGETVVYTSITDQTNVLQTVTAFGDAGISVSDTNKPSTAYVVQGSAVIRHQ